MTAPSSELAESGPSRWPAVPALRDPRGIERALRPLTVRAQSPGRKVLDEDKTATVAAEERIWLPQWKPAPWRQFELALVVDSSQTMEIWQQTVDEFTEILCHLGAFRNVRTYRFDGGHKTDPGLTWTGVVDPTGLRIVLMLTDAIGAAWRTGAAERVVAHLAGQLPPTIVNVIEDWLWSWGGLSRNESRFSRRGLAYLTASFDFDLTLRSRPSGSPVSSQLRHSVCPWENELTRFVSLTFLAIVPACMSHTREFPQRRRYAVRSGTCGRDGQKLALPQYPGENPSRSFRTGIFRQGKITLQGDREIPRVCEISALTRRAVPEFLTMPPTGSTKVREVEV